MSILREIEHGYETQFGNEADLKFRATVRCNSLLGHWAAQKLGMTGPETRQYARDIVEGDLENPEADGVFKRIRADFDAKGVIFSDHQLRRTMDELMSRALAELKGATGA